MIQIFKNMGFRYVLCRIWHEIQRGTGLLMLRFPVHKRPLPHFSKEDWLDQDIQFPLDPGRTDLIKNTASSILQERVEHIRRNRFLFFHNRWYTVPDWHTNPENGFKYNKNTHWSAIPTLSKEAGDIKYVWEKSRFCFLFDLLRYDYHFQKDQSELVFALILDWIDQNPVNRGPNWICSQEISLRVLNWTSALHYYKNSETLSAEIFKKITQSIYDQMRHVADHIHYSRNVVRNNHALTETLALYVIGYAFPQFPESLKWKINGKKWFEKEIVYQIYPDGTFLQFSMNYHRVAVQLLTLAIQVAESDGEKFDDVIYDRARKSYHFLRTCQDDVSGWLPNYGNNDGALFFPLADTHFRDFRPQLTALSKVIGDDPDFKPTLITTFENGGYYIIRDQNTLTFLRCGTYTNRPFQADHLHLDIWANGKNIMRDAGSFSYNTEDKWTKYFNGSASHNTVMLGDFDQMKKGPRFIWFGWIKKTSGFVNERVNAFEIEAEFEGFYHLGKGIKHHRRVTKSKKWHQWIIEDRIENAPKHLPMHQIWHPCPDFFEHYHMISSDKEGSIIEFEETEGWYSGTYGSKEVCQRLVFSTFSGFIRTVISEKGLYETNAHSFDPPIFS
ncbi:alginate lyase family protein [Dyadobacter chenhuakuii]|uniref:Heparinase II/III family protein n=1 Tax=Dyadobacter chenhuakuii TaxID=2909339 RepID=A0ABY4XHB0_9BACT|nr:alginate lyase family protein [Dyadobacter chenhuakuii]MCF2495586.1 heparinase II/III family protein [Dyadobacter chenhuakuii]USJ29621.1 heparinase II/III family protein [Dyadobacter chenhuakuii]